MRIYKCSKFSNSTLRIEDAKGIIKESKGKENLVQVSGESKETKAFRTNLVLSCLSISPFMGVSCLPTYKTLNYRVISDIYLSMVFMSYVVCLTDKGYLLVWSIL